MDYNQWVNFSLVLSLEIAQNDIAEICHQNNNGIGTIAINKEKTWPNGARPLKIRTKEMNEMTFEAKMIESEKRRMTTCLKREWLISDQRCHKLAAWRASSVDAAQKAKANGNTTQSTPIVWLMMFCCLNGSSL